MGSLWLLLFLFMDLSYASEQIVRVFGRVTCNRRSYEGAVIKLMERDALDPNDELATITTGKKGAFDLIGREDEIGDLDLFLLVEHGCRVEKPNCKRVAELAIPKKYINSKDGYNMTYLALDIWLGEAEEEKC